MYTFSQSAAFGKLERDSSGQIQAWHPLLDHLIDVAFCFVRLCQCRGIRRALERTAGRRLSAQDLERLAVLVFLHDLGKASSGFQAKRWLAEQTPTGWPHPTGHGREAMRLFENEPFLQALVSTLPVDEIMTWGEAVEPLLKASISHHGRPIIEDSHDWVRAIWRPVCGSDGGVRYDPQPVLAQIGQAARDLFPLAVASGGEPLPTAAPFGHLFAGLVQLADWLGSDTRFFPFSLPGEVRATTAPACAERAVHALGLDAEAARAPITREPPAFAAIFDNPPYPNQAAMGDVVLGPLVILESETGSGKTEAALWRFAQLFAQGAVDSLYFALPTRVSASQLYERLRIAVDRLWPGDPPLTVRALPGYASADGHEPRALPDFRVLWPDEPEDAQAHRRWAAESTKRFLAAPLAVGTIDQALLAALQVRHAHLRHALLARSLLVVDEVHASDPYMTVLLERLLQMHLGSGGQALLLSATLGSRARERYRALCADGPFAPPDFATACALPYPAFCDGSKLHGLASTMPPKNLSWTLLDAIDDPERIAHLALEAAATGAKVLIVRNTVPAARAVFQAVEALEPEPDWLFCVNGVSTLHHSRFSREDRPLLDAAIQAQLGRERPRGPRIVIGTQTLEQSLDLDADLLITDLCPMDILLQRIGRLHRHPRNPAQRPEAYRHPQAWVLTPPEHDLTPLLKQSRHGLGPFRKDGDGIYPDLRVIEATRRLIVEHPTPSIPADNRRLVEGATHEERLREIEAQGTEWCALGQLIEGNTGAQRTIAHLHVLDFEKPFDEHPAFPTDLDIATRLGERDRLLTFDPAPPGPFGEPLLHLPVRHFLVAGIDPETQPTGVTLTEGAVQFELGGTHFRYGRVGLEKV
ncbi:CRISPR-associated helicase/endonuclease Cas3 [Halorhodospira abdelmalekii]|uniref:CRISPR-associated helicase Cas3' n=1 Tax=Halorhodospira abdelmalekii TaxID=421629 RepID=UPI0019079602|nr:CRISPR-associated helicase Cas3' [Halorhodospira abdelmalekii]MBK1734172.1 CRISPR-associated helicase/endonuclease Cas3 [Halorhodospira abdelmalekii]